ncbi:MAG: hypothetical protein Kow00121_68650 [Elainellaceae cyanobacterium]
MPEPFLQDDAIAPSTQSNPLVPNNATPDRQLSGNLLTESQCERLLEATATVAHILLTAENLDASIKQALQTIGEALDTDRVNIIENFEHPSSSFLHWRILYEWDSPGTIPQFSDLNAAQGSYANIPELFERLRQGLPTSYLIEAAPEPFRSSQIAIGVQATYLVPIQVESQWWGIVGLDDCREVKHRSSTELSILGILANCVGSTIQRQRTQQVLLEAEQVQVAELAKANEELQQRDRLLSTVAEVTKDLLENPQVDDAIAQALQRIGEAAGIDRITLMLEKQDDCSGQLQHQVVYEWVTPNTPKQMNHPETAVMNNDDYGFLIDELHAGRSIWHVLEDFPEPAQTQQAGIKVKSTGAVPIFIEGKYFGCVGFDDCVTYRQWTAHEIDVLTSGAGAIGAALHRKQLVDRLVAKQTAIAREQEKAAQQQAAELSRVNTLLRNSLSRLSTEPNLNDVLGQLLLEVTRYAGASVGHVFSYDATHDALTMKLRVRDEQVFWAPADDEPAIFRSPISVSTTPVFTHLCHHPQLATLNVNEFKGRLWQGVPEWFQAKGIQATSSCVLLVGDRPFGMLAMSFPKPIVLRLVDEELILALAQQIALVMQLTTLAESSQEAALLEERNRMARDIHDTLAQSFTGVIMQLEATKRKIASAQLSVAQDHIARARSLAQAGLSEARRSVRALRPETLESNDLPDALYHLAQQMTDDTSVQISVEIQGATYSLISDVENNLLRIAQEALTNALRHAAPQIVRLQLHFTSNAIQLCIQDNGCGFNPESQVGKGFGLVGMQERSQRIGGEFTLTSTIGQGTEILVSVPVL